MPAGGSSSTTLKRIHREMADIKKEDLGDITLAPLENNMHIWRGSIPGPEGSVYEGGVFQIEVVLPSDYPFSAPKAVFKTRIYHMNISEQGAICIDILKHNWSPALSLFKLLLSLSSLLTDPNPKDPLVPSIATEYLRNRKAHDTKARQWTELYAKPKPPAAIPALPSKPTPAALPPARLSRSSRRAPVPVSSSSSTSRGGPSRSTAHNAAPGSSTAILIDDSDEERRNTTSARGKRKRAEESANTSSRSQRRNIVAVPDMAGDLDDDEQPVVSRPSAKRARTRGSRTAVNSGDVIVIED